MILKLSFSFLLALNSLAVTVVVSQEPIKFEEKIDASMLKVKDVPSLAKNCKPISLTQIESDEYLSSHYINKNTIICERDIKKNGDNAIIFNFGGVRIEKKGKIIFENNDFIRFKNLDGTIEQIYKDGRIK